MSTLDAPTTSVARHRATTSSDRSATAVTDPAATSTAGAPDVLDAPVAPVVAARPSRLAVAALVVGLVSLFLSTVPLVNAVSVLGGLVAVALAVRALRTLAPGVGGRRHAVGGLALGVVAALVAVTVWVVLGAAAQALEDAPLGATAPVAGGPALSAAGDPR